jgi:hypothetical protein
MTIILSLKFTDLRSAQSLVKTRVLCRCIQQKREKTAKELR